MRTIEITTTQNVTIEYELASLRDRIFAYLIDLIIVGMIYLIVFIAVMSIFENQVDEGGFTVVGFFTQFFPLVLFFGYHLFSEIMADGQTWGKKALGIKVVRLDGKEPTLSDYLLRAVFHIVDTLFSMGIVAALLISSTGKKQRLGDMTANTTVIRVKFSLRFRLEDILKINSLEDYEPAFPEVKRLQEKDMLLIKTIISRHGQHRNQAHREVVNELISHLMVQLDLQERPVDQIEFLKTLIRDYIVLTR